MADSVKSISDSWQSSAAEAAPGGVHIRSGDVGEADTLPRHNGEADHS